MINIADIRHISAADRHKAADALQAWAQTATVEEQKALVATLAAKISEIDAAQAAVERKKVALARIGAAGETLAGKNMLGMLEGTLRRGGVPSIESLLDKSLVEIDAIFAVSKLSVSERMAAKTQLHRLGVIEK
jgi:hypothetical protein